MLMCAHIITVPIVKWLICKAPREERMSIPVRIGFLPIGTLLSVYGLASDTKSCLLTTVELGHTFQAVFESQSKTLQACYTLFRSNLQCAGPKATSHSGHSCRTEQSVCHI